MIKNSSSSPVPNERHRDGSLGNSTVGTVMWDDLSSRFPGGLSKSVSTWCITYRPGLMRLDEFSDGLFIGCSLFVCLSPSW
jgi:hypothetical protein